MEDAKKKKEEAAAALKNAKKPPASKPPVSNTSKEIDSENIVDDMNDVKFKIKMYM